MTVSIEGLDALDGKVAELSSRVRAAAEAAVETETQEVAADMRAAAPKDTGELVDSIEAVTDGLSGTARATARHAVFVEFGTSSTPAQPFAGPAAELSRTRFPRQLRAAVRDAIGEV